MITEKIRKRKINPEKHIERLDIEIQALTEKINSSIAARKEKEREREQFKEMQYVEILREIEVTPEQLKYIVNKIKLGGIPNEGIAIPAHETISAVSTTTKNLNNNKERGSDHEEID